MNKTYFVFVGLLTSAALTAQVGINTPNPQATLHVKESGVSTKVDGVIPPRLTGDELKAKDQVYTNNQLATLVYITSGVTSAAEGKTADIKSPGYYYFEPSLDTNGKWVKVQTSLDSPIRFFYMPSIVFNTSATGTGLKRNLYAEYRAQFTNKKFVSNSTTGGSIGTEPRTTFVKSTNAPETITVIPNANQLYYYVTDYDTTSMANLSIDENGILTYDVIGNGTDYSFVNIVFVMK
ncbi:hypothetical protein VUJ46_01985 [Chryseobacterium sp. MYb264]|uniref:hypothetical protein n=1 Tax=Chryseobacterium sp. MYb264 TaxID=2745153 RepID=UPI002E167C42|nr:hypothetical protein VUJ46_01985 [Chryseobacterium sp. MYb264]